MTLVTAKKQHRCWKTRAYARMCARMCACEVVLNGNRFTRTKGVSFEKYTDKRIISIQKKSISDLGRNCKPVHLSKHSINSKNNVALADFSVQLTLNSMFCEKKVVLFGCVK